MVQRTPSGPQPGVGNCPPPKFSKWCLIDRYKVITILPPTKVVPQQVIIISPRKYQLFAHCTPFSPTVPSVLHKAEFSNQGSASGTDRNCLGRNSQPQFYAVVAIPLFHSILATVNRIENPVYQLVWLIAPFVVRNPMPQGSMSKANICGRFRCSKQVEKHCHKVYIKVITYKISIFIVVWGNHSLKKIFKCLKLDVWTQHQQYAWCVYIYRGATLQFNNFWSRILWLAQSNALLKTRNKVRFISLLSL